MINASKISEVINLYKFKYISDEKRLQTELEAVFDKHNEVPVFEREYRLDNKSIADFFFPSTGVLVEVKLKGSSSNLIRQLHRYAGFDEVGELLVVTTKWQLAVSLPYSLNEKPVSFIKLGGYL